MQTILVAAGLASRSGGTKLLLPYKGRPIIYHSLAASLEAGLPTTVVTGFKAEEVQEAIAPLHSDLVTVVHNSEYRLGQGSSVRAGVAALEHPSSFFIALADMPTLKAKHYRALTAAFTGGALRPRCQSQVGHPVLLEASFIPIILQQKGAFRMQELLAPYPLSYYDSSDEAYIRDVDTLASYHRLIDS
ncbi:MAG TPA: nucleotidyltransferase family protein [Sphaerochaeta sp.]|nr:nucleotidyltransferase family protein [Sphaerochaeta sp.]